MATIREQYAANIVLDHNYRKGSISDFSGNGNNGTVVNTVQWTKGERGRAIHFSQFGSGHLTIADSSSLKPSNFTICVFGNFDSQVTSERLIYKRSATTNYDFYVDATSINLYNGTSISTLLATLTGCNMLGVTITSGQTPKFYKDGIKLGDGSAALTINTTNTPPLLIGAEVGSVNANRNPFYEVIIFNIQLSQQEMAQFYEEWLQEGNYDVPEVRHLDNRYDAYDATGADSLPVYLADGLGWNTTLANAIASSLSNTNWRIISGTWSLTDSLQKINGAQKFVDGDMELSGVTNWTGIYGSPTITKDITSPHSGAQCLRIAYNGTTNPTVGQTGLLTTGKSYRIRGWARSDGVKSPSVWITNGSTYDWLGTTSTSWQFFDVAGVYNGSLALHAPTFMLHSNAAGYVEFDDVELFEVLPDGHKIQNVVAGAVFKPMDIVYGTWEFELYRGGASNVANIMLTASVPAIPTDASQNGYMLTINAVEQIVAYRVDAGVGVTKFATVASYISQTGWYSFKITRSVAGVWNFYTKVSGAWTLIAANAGANPFTDNTYTTSLFSVIDIDAGDCIRNFIFKPYVT